MEFCLKNISYMEAGTDFEKALPRFPFQSWQRHAHVEELGFRDFSSLFLVKENRRQLGNSACCISFVRISLIVSLCNRLLALEWNCSKKILRKRQFARPLTILLSDRDEGMGLV